LSDEKSPCLCPCPNGNCPVWNPFRFVMVTGSLPRSRRFLPPISDPVEYPRGFCGRRGRNFPSFLLYPQSGCNQLRRKSRPPPSQSKSPFFCFFELPGDVWQFRNASPYPFIFACCFCGWCQPTVYICFPRVLNSSPIYSGDSQRIHPPPRVESVRSIFTFPPSFFFFLCF